MTIVSSHIVIVSNELRLFTRTSYVIYSILSISLSFSYIRAYLLDSGWRLHSSLCLLVFLIVFSSYLVTHVSMDTFDIWESVIIHLNSLLSRCY